MMFPNIVASAVDKGLLDKGQSAQVHSPQKRINVNEK